MSWKIYLHTNLLNNKHYVGITKMKLCKRWRGGNGYQTQEKFYRAIVKYGWNNFSHEVLREVETAEEAIEMEAFYIDFYDSVKNGYNQMYKSIGTGACSEDKKQHQREAAKRRGIPKAQHDFMHAQARKKIVQLTKNGVFLRTWNSIDEAQTALGITHICECCRGKRPSTGGYKWRYL